ncbi:MAG: cryptochrome/photolyase family protein [Candidatus Aenigmatarchaeota archaeon]
MASIILPNQLFPKPLDEEKKYLVEHPKFFTSKNFHKKKLVLHRASMNAYAERFEVEYLEYREELEKVFSQEETLRIYDPIDHEIREQLENLAEKHSVELEIVENPGFLISMDWNQEYFSDSGYFHLEYYKSVRKEEDILVDGDGSPVGGKWSFDPDNRKKMPEDLEKPEIPEFSSDHVEEAKRYVEENFPDNPGEIDSFFWPINRKQALENLEDFLEKRLDKFGDYQDAIDSDLKFGFHSLLSPSLNLGLITPREVVEKTLEKHEEKDYPLNSLEGFLRQIIGWREFIRALYELEPEMDETDFWEADNELPEEFYTAETGLPPVDDSINHALEDAYCHHIERLMVLGNVMLLLEIDPDEVYNWFMEMFIDAYEWVMVPNIYGMSQYTWPEMMTKPYISSSNYIRKMSNYSGGNWEDYWDGLYWSFINRHKDKIEDIPRMGFMVSHLENMSAETLEEHVQNAEDFKKELTEYRNASEEIK